MSRVDKSKVLCDVSWRHGDKKSERLEEPHPHRQVTRGATEETDVIKVYVHRREHIASLVICMCRVTTIGFIECDQYPPVSRRGHLPSIQLRYRGTIRTSVHQGDAPG